MANLSLTTPDPGAAFPGLAQFLLRPRPFEGGRKWKVGRERWFGSSDPLINLLRALRRRRRRLTRTLHFVELEREG